MNVPPALDLATAKAPLTHISTMPVRLPGVPMVEGVWYRSGRLESIIEEQNEQILTLDGTANLLCGCVWVFAVLAIIATGLCIYFAVTAYH